jgi:hypothetical protein
VGVGRALADLVQDRCRLAEFRFRQPYVTHKGVQVTHQRHHDFTQTRIARALHHGQRIGRQLFVTGIDHSGFLSSVARLAKAGRRQPYFRLWGFRNRAEPGGNRLPG